MNTINTYIGNNPPKNSNTIWLRPLKQGGVGFYVWVNNKWNTIKLMDTKGSRTPMDDTPIDIDGDSDHYYTKDLIDDKFADIFGLDAQGILELITIISDGDALTGLLTELENKVDKTKDNIVTGSIKASVPGGYKLTNSAGMGVIMGNTTSTYSALTSGGIEFTNSTGGLRDALYLTGNKVNGRVQVGIFASPDEAYKNLAYTNDIPTSLALLSDDTTHRTVTDEDKTMWNYVSNQFKNALIEDHILGNSISAGAFTAEHSGTFLLQGMLWTTGRDIEFTFVIDRGELHTIVYREVITVTPSDSSATINIEQEVESGDRIHWSTSVYDFDDLHGSITTCKINYIDLSTLASVAKITFTTASSASINAERNKYYRVTNDVFGNVALTLPNSLLLSGDYVGCSFKTTSGAAGTVSVTCTNIDVYKQDGWSSIFSASAAFEIIALYDGNKWMCTFTKFTT